MFDLDLDPVESASISEDAAKVILQLEAWHQARMDHLQSIAREDFQKIDVNGVANDNPDFIGGFKTGLLMAVQLIGDLPVKVSE